MEVKAALEMGSDSRTGAEWTSVVTQGDNSQLRHCVRAIAGHQV